MPFLLFNFLGPEIIILAFGLFLMATFVLTIWAAIEIATKPFKREKDKVIWLIIVLLLGGIGPIIYYFNRKNLLAATEGNDREYLPPLEDPQARPQVQSRLDNNQDDFV
ncbi:PLD nuclease N-terminal domain-containing protein [Neolewinella persica]|uniref:PLD nuclease N-terminal domain-containing protein n=1 Tax=Neolewinella persica TaxID=70998 RepID=UPI00037EDC13|nr:PLD nuclease N-terminal domain-containing protein [Neolewinella persica]